MSAAGGGDRNRQEQNHGSVQLEVNHSRVLRIAEASPIARRETIAVSRSSAGGLISAALQPVPGASAYYRGGGVIYTRKAMGALLQARARQVGKHVRSATEPMARLLAETVRTEARRRLRILAQTGATGPTGNRYGDAAEARLPRGLRDRAKAKPGAGDRIERPYGQLGHVRERGAGIAGVVRLPRP